MYAHYPPPPISSSSAFTSLQNIITFKILWLYLIHQLEFWNATWNTFLPVYTEPLSNNGQITQLKQFFVLTVLSCSASKHSYWAVPISWFYQVKVIGTVHNVSTSALKRDLVGQYRVVLENCPNWLVIEVFSWICIRWF